MMIDDQENESKFIENLQQMQYVYGQFILAEL